MDDIRQASAKRTSRIASFTLIEILMVIAIVVVVAALLSPALRAAKERAYAVKCMSNLHHIGVGILLYASDYKVFPYDRHYIDNCHWYEFILPQMIPGNYTRLNSNPANKDYVMWRKDGVTAGQPYIRARWPLFQCPAAPKPSAQKYAHHYGCNGMIFVTSKENGYFALPLPRQNEFNTVDDRPGSILLAADVGVWSPAFSDNNAGLDMSSLTEDIAADFATSPATAPSRAYDPVITPDAWNNDTTGMGGASLVYTRHFNKCNGVFADGHVAAFSNGELQRRNFCSRSRTYSWGASAWVNLNYP